MVSDCNILVHGKTVRKASARYVGGSGKLPTCTEAGYKACYQCQSCKKLYLDKAGTEETTVEEITLPPTGHQYKDGICTIARQKIRIM